MGETVHSHNKTHSAIIYIVVIPKNHKVVILYLIGAVHIIYSAIIVTDYRLLGFRFAIFILGGMYAFTALVFYFSQMYWIFEKIELKLPSYIQRKQRVSPAKIEEVSSTMDDDDFEGGLIRWWVTTPLLPQTLKEWSIATLIVIMCVLFFGLSFLRLLSGYSGIDVFRVWNAL